MHLAVYLKRVFPRICERSFLFFQEITPLSAFVRTSFLCVFADACGFSSALLLKGVRGSSWICPHLRHYRTPTSWSKSAENRKKLSEQPIAVSLISVTCQMI